MCSQDQAISVRELQQMLNGVLSRRESAPPVRINQIPCRSNYN